MRNPVFLSLIIMLAGCAGGGGTVSGNGSEEIPLRTVYEKYFPVGAAVAAGEFSFNSLTAYPGPILGEFSSLTAENAMKPSVIQPTRGSFVWTYADRIVEYASKNGMLVRGHTLIWHSQTPRWMFLEKGTREERKAFARNSMRSHIRAVAGRYAGSVYCWDVVNEAVSDGGGYRVESPWYEAYGDASYVVDAFDFAREADPDCKLYYNDYNLVVSHKREMVVEMINELDLKSHGLTGIGIQGHWNLEWPTVQEIEETINTFHDMGLDVQITELDINCYNQSDDPKTRPYGGYENALAKRYREIFACFRRNADKISGVTFWGVADDHTWLDNFYGNVWHDKEVRKNYPLLFGMKREKKKAYFMVHDF